MISILLMKKIISLFLMMLMGFILVRYKLLDSKDSKGLSVIALYLVIPCTIIEAFQVDFTPEKRNGLILAFIAAIFVHIILLIINYICSKCFKLNTIEQSSLIYSNAGNLIIPLVTSVLGKEWILYSSAFVSVQLILMWTHGKVLICGDRSLELKKIFTNINMISILIGFIFFITGFKIPEILKDTVVSVGSLIGPVCMIVSGMLIGNIKFEHVLGYKRLPLIVVLRLIVVPIIILMSFKISGIGNFILNGETILLITFLATMTPSAATVTQMAQVYGNDAEYASIINVVTTLLCIATMPIMVFLYQII